MRVAPLLIKLNTIILLIREKRCILLFDIEKMPNFYIAARIEVTMLFPTAE
jgi:hypothetical protein